MTADAATVNRLAGAMETGVRHRSRILTEAVELVRRSSPPLFVLTAVLLLASAASSVAQVTAAATLVRAVVRTDQSLTGALWPLAALAALTAFSAAATVVSARVQRVLAEQVARCVWSDVLTTTSHVPLSAYDTADFSERLSRVQQHAVGRPLQVVTALSSLVAGALGVVGFLAYLTSVHWALALLVVGAGVPTLFGARVSSRREYRFAHQVTVLYRLRLYTAQLLAGRDSSKELRAYGFGRWLRDRHDALYGEFVEQLTVHSRRQAVLQVAAALVSTALASTALLALLLLVHVGAIDVAAAAGAALALRLLAGRVHELATGSGQVYESALFLEDLHELVRTPVAAATPAASDSSLPGHLGRLESLVLADVSFSYPGTAVPSLRGVDLEVRPGQVLALVGENGSGKTTLAKVASHLYPANAGEVLWNGHRAEGAGQVDAIRRRIAVLFQDFGKYAFSAADTVYVGDVEARGDAARRDAAAEKAGADEVVNHLGEGWETLLAAEYGGQDLSGGQWQRLALARVHFRNADLVILDEPTAALDPRAEARLFHDVRRVFADKAVLLITHRLTSARTADVIVVLKHGEVVERGSHQELMAAGGTYAELWELQAAGYAVDADEAVTGSPR